MKRTARRVLLVAIALGVAVVGEWWLRMSGLQP